MSTTQGGEEVGVLVGELDRDGHGVEDHYGARGKAMEGISDDSGVGASGEERLHAAEQRSGEDNNGGGSIVGSSILRAGELNEGHAGEDDGTVVGDDDLLCLVPKEIILSMLRGPREVCTVSRAPTSASSRYLVNRQGA